MVRTASAEPKSSGKHLWSLSSLLLLVTTDSTPYNPSSSASPPCVPLRSRTAPSPRSSPTSADLTSNSCDIRARTPAAVFKWAPTLALWGGAGAGAVMLFMSSVPLFKKDVLIKLPVIAPYFEDKTHPADNAF
ncbi:hypothetical protein PANT_8d00052 [Moesziomyces antarcticus T-34]|uniref:Uncharacterized protein n=1 Tax=Pseudozyma antarctica (strain T-34) TaxID=1151754 RepID=M9M016_PSEA3|nr:hypothetical protein PANT_8d00052 [Moesziomyces antarcticus T-34]